MQRFALIVLAASGCAWNAQVVTQDVSVGLREVVDVGPLAGWNITTAVDPGGANAVVTAARVQSCTRTTYDVYDEYTHKMLVAEPHDVNWNGDPRGILAIPAVLVVVGLVSLAVSQIDVAASHKTKARRSRLRGERHMTCDHAVANAPVELALPSGAVLRSMTDGDGHARFAIPADEPDIGTVVARVADQTRPAPFYRTGAGCERMRDEMFARVVRSTELGYRSRVLHVLPVACGDARSHAWSLTAAAALVAVESRCAPIESFASQVRAIDADLYASSFVTEPDIARCLRAHIASEDHAACIRDRREQLRRSGPRMLADLPSCDAEVPGDPRSAADDLPRTLDRQMVASAMADVTRRALACGGVAPGPRTVKVHVTVTGDGRVSRVAIASAPEPRLGACVAAVVRDAAFAETWNGGAFGYTFAL